MTQAKTAVRLGEIVELVLGKCSPSRVGNGGAGEMPFVRVGEFGEVRPRVNRWTRTPLRKARAGDVLLGIVGSTSGRINLSEECAIGRSVAALRPNPSKLDQLYLFYFLKAAVENLRSDARDQGLTLITKKTLQAMEIPLVPLSEQRRIVERLHEALDGISLAKANADKNLLNARSLYARRLECVFSCHGSGWLKKPLAELCKVKHGFGFPRQAFSLADAPEKPVVLTVGNFTKDGALDFGPKNTKRLLKGEAPARYILNRGDLVVVMTDLSPKMKMLGKPAFVDRIGLLHNQRIGRVEFLGESIDPRLVYYFMMSEAFLRDIKGAATGKTARHTAPSRILSNLICFPVDRDKQVSLTAELDFFRNEVKRLEILYEQKLGSLEDLERSILERTFGCAD